MQKEPWNIGARIASARRSAGKTLRQTAEITAAYDPEGKGVLPAQISRIENGAVCDLRELCLLAQAFNVQTESLLAPKTPWFVIRRAASEQLLAEVTAGSKIVERHDGAHQEMITSRVYRYAPLIGSSDLVEEDGGEGEWSPHLMRKYLVQIGRCDERGMVPDSHTGEEIVWVLEGEIEFWAQQPDRTEPERRVTLHPGDCVHYASTLRHGYRATGSSEYARVLLIFTPTLTVPTAAGQDVSQRKASQ